MIKTLPFLGKRHYLQGTTLFDCLWEIASQPACFSYKINRPILSNAIKITTGNMPDASAVLIFGNKRLSVTQLPVKAPVSREEYDEEKITSHMVCTKNGLEIPLNGETPLRGMVAAFKDILLKSYPVPNFPGHWAFARLDATRYADEAPAVILTNIICQYGRACCSVHSGKRLYASLYFAWADF